MKAVAEIDRTEYISMQNINSPCIFPQTYEDWYGVRGMEVVDSQEAQELFGNTEYEYSLFKALDTIYPGTEQI